MIIGYTHDDIDALFWGWNMLLKKESFPIVPVLMKSFMDVESSPTILHSIKEVPNFKGLIAGSFNNGDDMLIGYTRPQQVKLYLHSN